VTCHLYLVVYTLPRDTLIKSLTRNDSGCSLYDLLGRYPKLCDQTLRSGRCALRRTNEAEVPKYPQGLEGQGMQGKTGRVGTNSHTSRIDALADSNETGGDPFKFPLLEKTRMFLGESCLTSSNPFGK